MLITIARYDYPLDAHIVRGRLEAEGIRAHVVHEHHVWANWALGQALGQVKLQVAADDWRQASDVLADLAAGHHDLGSEAATHPACPDCGGIRVEAVDRWRKLALWVVFACSVPLPFSRYRFRCIDCDRSWTSGELRGYPFWVVAMVTMLVGAALVILVRTLFYLCMVNDWNPVCLYCPVCLY